MPYKNKEDMVRWRKRYRRRLRQHLFDILTESKCVKCGITDPLVLEFDHLDPSTKVGCISALTPHISSAELDKEIAKCQVLCANCHRIKTAEDQGWYKHVKRRVE